MLTFVLGVAGIAALFSLWVYVEQRTLPALDGYEHPELVEVIFQKTKAFKPSESWPEMAGVSSVLDFGGGCGIHYKQANSPDIRWAVVETPAMVERAKELATNRLQFFTDISEAHRWLGDVDVMHSNGALQYADDPVSVLKQLCAVKAKTMLWYRVALSTDSIARQLQSSRLSDNGPGKINVDQKTVRYQLTKIPERDFIAAHADYRLAERGQDWFRFTLSTDQA